ncbi:MAG TPA: pyruvate dehydrogenase (acetyl-transferring) E1 component subunit alpha [Candidatus Limnocylindria bacterium]|nr:pyruvate dehydrogenase (acetyl-transferring) E1 component subunit alpha [Candidatus Limnocylindria bacterium]
MGLRLLTALRDDGTVDPALDPALSREDLLFLFRKMLLLRALDEKAVLLQRAGRIGFFVPSSGQEAAEIGSGYALREGDWVFPSYRDHGVALLRGYPLETLVGQLFGNASDAMKGRQMPNHWCDRSINLVSVSSPVATQLPQAVGAAYAAKLRGEKVAAIVYFGDGGSSTGAFHVAMNFAGVYRTPTVFFCSNNQYAISLPVSLQTASGSIAEKADAYGFKGVRVDGNDVLAVTKVTRDALAKARAGGGPTLIEAVTYRMGPHSTSDDPTRYRSEEEIAEWAKRDPVRRFTGHLRQVGILDEKTATVFAEEAREEVARVVKECESAPPVPPESLVEDVYAEMPWHLIEQRKWLPHAEE